MSDDIKDKLTDMLLGGDETLKFGESVITSVNGTMPGATPLAVGRYETVSTLKGTDTTLRIFRTVAALPNGPDMEVIEYVMKNTLPFYKMRDIFDMVAMIPGVTRIEIFDANDQGVVMALGAA